MTKNQKHNLMQFKSLGKRRIRILMKGLCVYGCLNPNNAEGRYPKLTRHNQQRHQNV